MKPLSLLPLLPLGLAACFTAGLAPKDASSRGGAPYQTSGSNLPPGRLVEKSLLNVEDVQEALAKGDLEAAHATLTSILSRHFLMEARAKLEAKEFDAGWIALERALEYVPKNREALALKRETAGQFFEELLKQTNLALEKGRPEDALTLTDQALELRPEDSEALLLRGKGFFLLGRKVSSASFVEDSLATYLDAAARFDSAEAWLGASRSAYELVRTDDALEYARIARDKMGEVASPAELRIIAESVFGAYRAERQANPNSDECRALFMETEDILTALIGEAADMAWPYRELANLMSWQGYPEEARRALEQGLNQVPDDATLHDRFRGVVKNEGGNTALLEYYETFARRHLAIAIGRFNAGLARFDLAVESLLARAEGEAGIAETERLVDEFRAAEKDFVRARELDPTFEASAIGYEIVARDGLGWCLYHLGDLDGARDAFLSMEDLQAGGLRWELQDSLLSGVVSLELVAGAFFAGQQDDSKSDLEKALAMEKAAKIFDFLHEYEPEVVKWANNSGFFNRDVAVMLHDEARNLEAKLEREELTNEEAQALAAEGSQMLARAQELMERSYRAYVDTAKLATEDVRIINDTGLILTYYLERELEVAEEYLMRAVFLGEDQIKDDTLAPDARYELENALGDAYQNLGVLHLKLTGNVNEAKDWFAKSLAIGPDPRPAITTELLPLCEAAIADEITAPLVNENNRWSRPFRMPDKL